MTAQDRNETANVELPEKYRESPIFLGDNYFTINEPDRERRPTEEGSGESDFLR